MVRAALAVQNGQTLPVAGAADAPTNVSATSSWQTGFFVFASSAAAASLSEECLESQRLAEHLALTGGEVGGSAAVLRADEG